MEIKTTFFPQNEQSLNFLLEKTQTIENNGRIEMGM